MCIDIWEFGILVHILLTILISQLCFGLTYVCKKNVTLWVDFLIKYLSTCTTMVSTKERFRATTWNWLLFFFFVDFSSVHPSLVSMLNQCVSVFFLVFLLLILICHMYFFSVQWFYGTCQQGYQEYNIRLDFVWSF